MVWTYAHARSVDQTFVRTRNFPAGVISARSNELVGTVDSEIAVADLVLLWRNQGLGLEVCGPNSVLFRWTRLNAHFNYGPYSVCCCSDFICGLTHTLSTGLAPRKNKKGMDLALCSHNGPIAGQQPQVQELTRSPLKKKKKKGLRLSMTLR